VMASLSWSLLQSVHSWKRVGSSLSTSSPGFPESNGRAEAGLAAVWHIVDGAEDSVMPNRLSAAIVNGLISHRNSPQYGKTSPAEILFRHRMHDGVPSVNFSPVRVDNSLVIPPRLNAITPATEALVLPPHGILGMPW